MVKNQVNIFALWKTNSLQKKTIKCIKKEIGTIINEQAKILNEIKTFYQSFFNSYDQKLENINLNEYLSNYHVNKLTSEQAKTLEGEITISELGHALKCMKNGKTPGIDGFPADFLKLFWPKLKYFIQSSINYSYKHGELPLTLRQCIISCLSKGNKDRTRTGDRFRCF